MLRARPLAPLAAGFVAGIALTLFPGAGIPLVIAGLVLLEWDVPVAHRLRVALVERRWRSTSVTGAPSHP